MANIIRSFISKIFTPKEKIKSEIQPEPLNSDLIKKLTVLVNDENLNSVLNDPVNKLWVIGTYTNDFNDLLNNITAQKPIVRHLGCYNVCKYFILDDKIDVRLALEKVTNHIKTSRIDLKIIHDLDIICDAYNEMIEDM